ncbi:MAG: hypothetical protein ACFCU6_16155 [Balneolaceae bacterium]
MQSLTESVPGHTRSGLYGFRLAATAERAMIQLVTSRKDFL